MWFVYALQSQKDQGLYIGISQNPQKRVLEHNQGMTRSTRSRRPFVVIFRQECKNRAEARKQEKYYKSGCGREFLKTLIMPP